MKLIKPSYEILSYPSDALLRIERAARTCYKSEDRINDNSAKKLVINLLKKGHYSMIEFGGNIAVKFVSNRGFTHELVRHRLGSYAQESTRYCNYSKGKFGQEITCCLPIEQCDFITKEELIRAWKIAEKQYLLLIDNGASAEIAREVLPIGLKAEIVANANVREWRHIFSQRCSIKAHPRMRELMIPLQYELRKKIPIIFDPIFDDEK